MRHSNVFDVFTAIFDGQLTPDGPIYNGAGNSGASMVGHRYLKKKTSVHYWQSYAMDAKAEKGI
jgi:hypothetical protein